MDKRKIRVACADDHTMFRKGLVSILQSEESFQVVAEAPNGKELVRLIDGLKTPPDVCLLDINMPEMDGFETLITLKSKYPGIKFLILSMHDHEYVIIKMLKNGANGYLLKDDEPAELKKAIMTVYEKPFYHTDLVNGHLISLVQKGEEYSRLALSDPEQQFLAFCCSDLSYKQIADKMGLSTRTVEGYRDSLFSKLDVKSRTGLAIYSLKLGIVSLNV